MTLIAGVHLGHGILLGADTRLTWREQDSHGVTSDVHQKLYPIGEGLIAGLGLADFIDAVVNRIESDSAPLSTQHTYNVTIEEYGRLRGIDKGNDNDLWRRGLDATFLLVASSTPTLELAALGQMVQGPVAFDAVVLDGRNSSTTATLEAQSADLRALACLSLPFDELVGEAAKAMRDFILKSAQEDSFIGPTCQFALLTAEGQSTVSTMLQPSEPLGPLVTQMLRTVRHHD